MTRMHWRPDGRIVLVAAAAIGLAACSGGSSTPQVASLGQRGGASTGTPAGSGNAPATGTGNPAHLLDEWAACMRRHGDPSQTDPTINADQDIEISMTNVSPALSAEAHDSSGPCGHYLVAAATALRGGQPAAAGPSLAALLKYAACMRANGVPNYPDPSGSQTDLQAAGVNPDSPAFTKANAVCAKKTGMPASYTGAPPPGVVQVRGCNAPAGKQCPAGGPGANGGPATNG